MAAFQITTPEVETQPAAVVPDLASNIAEAQAAADWAYKLLQEADCPPAECAELYHVAYVDTMRSLGTPMPCACNYCQSQKGGEPLKV